MNIQNKLKETIKSKGLKYTQQRGIIFEMLFNINKHLTAEEIHQELKKIYPNNNIGIATVYRTLNLLEEAKLVSSILKDGIKRYELELDEHHDHLICLECGKIVEFIDEEIENRQKVIAKKNKFLLKEHSMQLYGICENCQKKLKE